LVYKDEIELSHRTTVDYMRQYFSNTVEKMGDIRVYQEGTYQSITLPVQLELLQKYSNFKLLSNAVMTIHINVVFHQ